MRRSFALSLALLFALCCAADPAPAPAQGPERIGVVLLHGKQGAPDRLVTEFAAALRAAGFLVATPEMPWSARRKFDVDYLAALAEIDAAARELKVAGATRMVAAGHSLGANAALAYAVRYPGVAAVICLAPGHAPETPKPREAFANDVARARAMVAAGRGAEAALFHDSNQGRELERRETAQGYLSYNDPDGPAVMPKNAAALPAPVPILWVVGSREEFKKGPEYAFARAPKHPYSRFAEVDADHRGVPLAAARLAVEWLQALPR